ncbi:hypothetical protein [Magnetospirillum moscoviense]|nr:hypothetical protein [Magnetospirillum moscoviense]
MVAFAHHDSDPDYQAAYDHYRSTKKTFDRVNERYEVERHKLQRRFDIKSASNAREVERLQVEVDVTFKALANLERQKTGFIDRILHVMRMRLTAYQSANLRARRQRPSGPSLFRRGENRRRGHAHPRRVRHHSR